MTLDEKIERVVSYHITRVVDVICLNDTATQKTKKIVIAKNDLITAIGNVFKN